MTRISDDWQELKRFGETGDAQAFADVVRRNIGFVYAAARRQTHDSHLAEDVTQAVFIVLARKARLLQPGASLSTWLFSVTRNASQNALKIRARRQYYESQAAARIEPACDAPEFASDLRPILDEAIARLPKIDQAGVLMHYFEERSHAEIGIALGLSADAARKRISRAVEKMRSFLSDRGVVMGAGALAASLTAEKSMAVTSTLETATVNVSLVSTSIGTTTNSIAIANGLWNGFIMTKLKIAAAIAIGFGTLAGVAVPITARAFAQPAAATVATAGASVPANGDRKFTTKLGEKMTLEFWGVSPNPPTEASWTTIAGEPVDPPALPEDRGANFNGEPPQHVLVLHIDKPQGTIAKLMIKDATSNSVSASRNTDSDTGVDEITIVSRFTLQHPHDAFDIEIGLSAKEWSAIGKHETIDQPGAVVTKEFGTFEFAAAREENGQCCVDVVHQEFDPPLRIVARDADGKLVESNNVNINGDGQTCTASYTFELPPEKLKSFEVQVRPFNRIVNVKNIALTPEKPTQPSIEVVDKE